MINSVKVKNLRTAVAVLCSYTCLFQQLQASSMPVARTSGSIKLPSFPNTAKELRQPAPKTMPTSSPGKMLDFPLFEEDGNYSSVLTLNNNGPKTVTIHPTFYNLQGIAYEAPAFQLSHSIPKRYRVSDLIKDAPGIFSQGNLDLQYDGQMMQVTGQVSILSTMHRGSFESLMDMESSGATLQEIVVLPTPDASIHLAVTNFSSTSVPVELKVNGKPASPTFSLGAHQTRVLSKRDLFGPAPVRLSALVSLSTGSNNSQISVAGAVLDSRTGYSSTLFFTDTSTSTSNTLVGTHFLSGFTRENKEAGNGNFTASIALANTSEAAITVDPLVNLTIKQPRSIKQQSDLVRLTPITLAAHQIQMVNISAELAFRGITDFFDTNGIQLNYTGAPGALLAQCRSVSDEGDLVIDTPLKDPRSGWGQGFGSHPWRIDGDYASTLYLTNILDKPSSAIVQISYEAGSYLPNTFSLKPHETIAVNLNQLSGQVKDDIKGNRFSSSAKQGRVKWVEIVTGSLVGRMEISNAKIHYSGSFSCGACDACSEYQSLQGPSPYGYTDVVGDSATQFTLPYYTYDCLSGTETGPYTLDNNQIYWSSDNSSVVSITTSGVGTPVGPGTANIYASTFYTGAAQPSETGMYTGCTVANYYQSSQFQVTSSVVDPSAYPNLSGIVNLTANQDGSFTATMSFDDYADFLANAQVYFQSECGCPDYSGVLNDIRTAIITAGVAITLATQQTMHDMLSFMNRQRPEAHSTPIKGQPNSVSSVDKSKPGSPGKTVRVYGSDGRAVRDIDYGNQAHSGYDPEVMDWTYDSNGTPTRGTPRAPQPGDIPPGY